MAETLIGRHRRTIVEVHAELDNERAERQAQNESLQRALQIVGEPLERGNVAWHALQYRIMEAAKTAEVSYNPDDKNPQSIHFGAKDTLHFGGGRQRFAIDGVTEDVGVRAEIDVSHLRPTDKDWLDLPAEISEAAQRRVHEISMQRALGGFTRFAVILSSQVSSDGSSRLAETPTVLESPAPPGTLQDPDRFTESWGARFDSEEFDEAIRGVYLNSQDPDSWISDLERQIAQINETSAFIADTIWTPGRT